MLVNKYWLTVMNTCVCMREREKDMYVISFKDNGLKFPSEIFNSRVHKFQTKTSKICSNKTICIKTNTYNVPYYDFSRGFDEYIPKGIYQNVK